MALFSRKPVLKVFIVSTPHVFSSEHDFLGVRKKVLEVVSPDVYAPEVAFESVSELHKRLLEQGDASIVENKFVKVNDFTLDELRHVISRKVPLRLLEGELGKDEKERFLQLASGVGQNLEPLPEKMLPLSKLDSSFLTRGNKLLQASAYRKLVLEVKKRAFGDEVPDPVRKASIAALHYFAFLRQDKLVRNLINSKSYGSSLKMSVSVMVGLGVGHESMLDTISRQVEEGNLLGFSGIKVHHVFVDFNGNVRADDEFKRLYGAKLRDVLRKSGYPYPLPESQKVFQEFERQKRASFVSLLKRGLNKLAFWRRL